MALRRARAAGAARRGLPRLRVAALVVLVASCGEHVLVGASATEDGGGPPPDAGSAPVDRAPPPLEAGAIRCGTTVCGVVELGASFGPSEPCCYDLTSCGTRFQNACVELESPGVPDPACPSIGSYEGCCRSDHTCGLSAERTAFGCVNPFTLLLTDALGRCTYPDE